MIGAFPKSGNSNLILMDRETAKNEDDLTFGFVPEEPILYDYLTVLKNFRISSFSKGIYGYDNEIKNLVRILKLGHLSTRKPGVCRKAKRKGCQLA